MEDSGEDENSEHKAGKESTESVSIVSLKVTFMLIFAKLYSAFLMHEFHPLLLPSLACANSTE